MVRLKGTDNLDDLNGALTGGFNAVTLGTLKAAYEATAPEAKQVMTDFFLAASQLKTRENEFNRRAKPVGEHTLLVNMPPQDHMLAMRAWTEAKASLLEVNPVVGQQILAVVERDRTTTARRGLKKTFGNT
ncbi:MAG: hypothetical protein ACAH80_02560 [Alphaproteobacteria bacterium]